ncbi:hypothetical protein R6Q57_029669 [Mikania cordata]
MSKFNNITEVADAVQTLELAEKMVPTGQDRKRDRDDDNYISSENKKAKSNRNSNHHTQMKTHRDTCHRLTGACFQYGQVGHLARDCKNSKPRRNGNNEATNSPLNTGGGVFAFTTGEAGNAQNNNA